MKGALLNVDERQTVRRPGRRQLRAEHSHAGRRWAPRDPAGAVEQRDVHLARLVEHPVRQRVRPCAAHRPERGFTSSRSRRGGPSGAPADNGCSQSEDRLAFETKTSARPPSTNTGIMSSAARRTTGTVRPVRTSSSMMSRVPGPGASS